MEVIHELHLGSHKLRYVLIYICHLNDTAAILDFSPSYYDGMLLSSYIAKLSHLLQYMTLNRMKNLAFGGHFGFSLPTHLAHVEEMEVLWIMAQEGLLDISRKIQLTLFFF